MPKVPLFLKLFAVTDKFRGLKVHLNYSLLHYSLYSNQQHLMASEKFINNLKNLMREKKEVNKSKERIWSANRKVSLYLSGGGAQERHRVPHFHSHSNRGHVTLTDQWGLSF